MWAYDFEVYPCWWCVVFINISSKEKKIFTSDNNITGLMEFIESIKFYVGFNNYNYDDIILYALTKLNYNAQGLYNLSIQLINKSISVTFRKDLSSFLSFDCIQELQMGVSLKQIECNLGIDIRETTTPFDTEILNENDKKDIIKYCIHDVLSTIKVFELREDYFKAKIEIVKTFDLPLCYIKQTRANLVSKVLKANKHNGRDKERLNIKFISNIKWENIPLEVKNFYFKMVDDFKKGIDFLEIEKRNLNIDIVDVPHTFGLGGLHGAKDKYINSSDKMLLVDVNSYYPSMMIIYDFLSRNCEDKEDFKNLYDTRFKLKANKEPREYIYKILLNATYGASKGKYNNLYDPLQANNICINGQLLLTDLIYRLKDCTKLIQTNTDGILFSYEDYNKVYIVINEWENDYKLKLGIDKVKAIYQRDVNNYLLIKENGDVKGKGRFKNFNKNKINFELNNLSIIDISLYNYYINNISIEKTIKELINNNNFLPFQLVAKKSNKYDFLAYHNLITDDYIKINTKVNRVFASKYTNKGKLYKVKDGKYSKYTNTPNNIYIFNKNLDKMDKNVIDTDFYVKLCKSYLIENMGVKVKMIDKGSGNVKWLI